MEQPRTGGESRVQSGPRFPTADLNAASMRYHLTQCGWIPEKEEKDDKDVQERRTLEVKSGAQQR